jgi:N-acetylneuraminic acid mutarotase
VQVYYCGGIDEDNTKTLGGCYEYDPATDQWSTAVPDMPKPRNHAATCTDGSRMFVFGGRDGRNVPGPGFSDTQIYTPGEGWSDGAALPIARGGTGKAVYHDGECYVFGGEVDSPQSPSTGSKVNEARTVYRVDVHNIAGDTWHEAQACILPLALLRVLGPFL